MILVLDQATQTLFAFLESLRNQTSTARALTLKSDHFQTPIGSWIETLSHFWNQNLDCDQAKFYVLEDGDAVLYATTLSRRKRYEIFETLAPYLKSDIDPNDVFDVFELNSDLHPLLVRIQEKFDVIKAEQDKIRTQELLEKKKKEEQKQRAILSIKIHETIKQHIKNKKAKRDTFEILLIDDDVFSCRMVENLLQKTYKTYKASTAWDAIMTFIKVAPDIVFLDIDMPLVTGHDILVKLFEADPHVHIVMLSGHANHDNIIKSMTAGARGFIAKPFTRDKLFQAIENHPVFLTRKTKGLPHVSSHLKN
jgi:CheY-like chemotaxis protein